MTNAKLEDRVIFGRNIVYFFNGQRDSVVDSDATKTRKQLTRERCERICTLSPDGLISWAVAFKPTIWTANLLSKETFDYLLDHIEPDNDHVWPADIYHILSGLGAEEPLRESYKYHEFVKAAEDDKKRAQSTNQSSKRRRISAASEGGLLSPSQTRESVAWNTDGHYTSSGIRSPHEVTETPANNQIASDKAEPSQASAKEMTNTKPVKYGDVYALNIEDARYALSSDQNVSDIWLTNPKAPHRIGQKSSFLTAWISEGLGEMLSKRGQQVHY
ncbi:hypothetical protein BJ875DRAFT_216585 [Amylocarpus encephaloides]|uniref:Uncharacterized protein n=1 Tax=Amylocarpus encephaloides TaxID=45428 RepID=A0A9P7Y889_9HELO|nr:hypothetical protein BJ875DRAFT_216585 [Amylocarpus encephaloides]